MSDADRDRRRRAVASLDPASEPEALLAGLDDPAWEVRHEAVRHLRARGAPELLLEALLDRVEGESIEARCAALEVLTALGPAVQRPVLARLNRGPSTSGAVRRFLVEALLEGADAGCIATLAPLLTDPDPTLAPVALEVLGTLDDPRARALVREALSHPDPVVRITALLALERRPQEAPVEELVVLAQAPLTAELACAILMAHGAREALEGVARALLGGSPLATRAALQALSTSLAELARGGLPEGLRGPLEAALAQTEATLVSALESPEAEVSAVLLALLGGPRAGLGARTLLEATPGSRFTNAAAVSRALLAHPAWMESLVGGGGPGAEDALAFLWRAGGQREPWARTLACGAAERGEGGPWPWALLLQTPEGLRWALEHLEHALDALDDAGWEFLLVSQAPAPIAWLAAILEREGPTALGMRAAEQLAAQGQDVDRGLLAQGERGGSKAREGALGARLYLGACTFDDLVAWTLEPSEALAEAAAYVLAQRPDTAAALAARFDALPVRTRCRLLRVSALLESHGALAARALEASEPEVVREAVTQLPDDAPLSVLERLVAHPDATVACEALARMLVVDPAEARLRAQALVLQGPQELRREALRALDPRSPPDRGWVLEALQGEAEGPLRRMMEAWLEPFREGRKTL